MNAELDAVLDFQAQFIRHQHGSASEINKFFAKYATLEQGYTEDINYIVGEDEFCYRLRQDRIPLLYKNIAELSIQEYRGNKIQELPSHNDGFKCVIEFKAHEAALAVVEGRIDRLLRRDDILKSISAASKSILRQIFKFPQLIMPKFADGRDRKFESYIYLHKKHIIITWPQVRLHNDDKGDLTIKLADSQFIDSLFRNNNIFRAMFEKINIHRDGYNTKFSLPNTSADNAYIELVSSLSAAVSTTVDQADAAFYDDYIQNILDNMETTYYNTATSTQMKATIEQSLIYNHRESEFFIIKSRQQLSEETSRNSTQTIITDLEDKITEIDRDCAIIDIGIIPMYLKIIPIAQWPNLREIIAYCVRKDKDRARPAYYYIAKWAVLYSRANKSINIDNSIKNIIAATQSTDDDQDYVDVDAAENITADDDLTPDEMWNDMKDNEGFYRNIKFYDCEFTLMRRIASLARASDNELFRQRRMDYLTNKILMYFEKYTAQVEDRMLAFLMYVYYAGRIVIDKSKDEARQGSTNSWFCYIDSPLNARNESNAAFKWLEYSELDVEHKCNAVINYIDTIYETVIKQVELRRNKIQSERDAELQTAEGGSAQLLLSRKKYYNDMLRKIDTEYGNIQKSRIGLLRRKKTEDARKMIGSFIREPGFASLLNSNGAILGVGNGIIDLMWRNPRTNKIEPKFINYDHEHLISRYTSTLYRPYDPNQREVKHIMQILADVIPELDAREKILMHIAAGLYGGSKTVQLLLIKGGGRNGKSTLGVLLFETFGHMYVIRARSALLTSAVEDSTAANSAFVAMRDKLFLIFSEFKMGDHLNDMQLKRIISQEKQTGRKLYENDSMFDLNGVPIAFTNVPLMFDAYDDGTWRRFITYTCRSKFVDKPDPAFPNEKKLDTSIIDHKFKEAAYKEAFLSILIHYFARLQNEFGGNITSVESPTIIADTEQYKLTQDHMSEFISKYLVPSDNKTQAIPLMTLADSYVAFLVKYNRNTLPTLVLDELKSATKIAHGIKTVSNIDYLIGYTIRTEDEVHMAENKPINLIQNDDNSYIISDSPETKSGADEFELMLQGEIKQ
jgi:phage/plasmid-associated DNA primase